MRYGYVRVSTKEQCIDGQLVALEHIGIQDSNIYVDKASTKEKEANIVVLDCHLLDTRKRINGVTGKFIW